MSAGPTLCLCMIARNEERVIERALRSVKGIIDYWIVCDTGSTDATPVVVLNTLSGVPGQLHRREWVNFGHNRSEAIRLARPHADYLLIMDADMVANVHDPAFKQKLLADYYEIRYEGDVDYTQPMLVSSRHEWRYVGVTHEYIDSPTARTREILSALTLTHVGDGAMRADKFARDARLLTEALGSDPDDPRTIFYLAQSLYFLNRYDEALPLYERRATLGGWEQERWYAMYMIGRVREWLQQPWDAALDAYKRAYEARPQRLEPLYQIVKHEREAGNYAAGYAYARIAGLAAPYPGDLLFIDRPLHLYLFPLELGVCAYGTARFAEAIAAFNLVLRRAPTERWIVDSAVRGRSMALADLPAPAAPAMSRGRRNHLVVVVPFHNPGDALGRCVTSLRQQDHEDFETICIDDASTDGSRRLIAPDPRIRIIVRPERQGLAQNLVDLLLRHCRRDDIVVCVDGDDWLTDPGALSLVDDTYRTYDCWLTFGQFEFANGDYGFSQPFASEDDFLTLREYFRASHLRTFRAGLFHRLADQDPDFNCLKDDNGEWLTSAVDAALTCPLLEMAGFDRQRFIDRVLYHYNDEGPDHLHSSGRKRQRQIGNFECVRRKPRFRRVDQYDAPALAEAR